MKWTLLPWRRKVEKETKKQATDLRSLQHELDAVLTRLAIVELGLQKLRHDHDEHIRRSRKKKASPKKQRPKTVFKRKDY